MKKISVLLALLCLFSLCSCGGTAKNPDTVDKDTLAGQIISLMNELTKHEERQIPGGADGIVEEICGGNYETPAAVYRISVDEDRLAMALRDGLDTADASPVLKRYYRGLLYSSFATFLTGQIAGNSAIASAALYSASLSAPMTGDDGNELRLYAFADGYPILIALRQGENGTVTASGSFLPLPDLWGNDEEKLNAVFADDLIPAVTGIEKIK